MLKKNNLFIKLIPASVILVCIAVISRFFSEPFTFPVNLDDCLYNALLQKYSIRELMQMLPGKYNGGLIAHFDGRMFSNFYSLLVFSLLKTNHSVYYLYNLFMFLVLLFSIYFLVNSLSKNRMISSLSISKQLLLSSFISCVLFIFLLDGRYEVFYWVSSISNHLLSIIFFVFTLALLICKPTFFRVLFMCILSFCIGQMNEVYAISFFLVFLFIAIASPSTRVSFLLMLVAVLSGLVINLSAHGTAVRFNVLYALPSHFNFTSSLKDTAYTLLLPFINFRYLPIKIPAVILLFFTIRNYLKIQVFIPDKYFLSFNRFLLFVALMSIFLHCYILGEICTYRGLLFYCLSLIYFIFIMAVKNILNPVKLFIR